MEKNFLQVGLKWGKKFLGPEMAYVKIEMAEIFFNFHFNFGPEMGKNLGKNPVFWPEMENFFNFLGLKWKIFR
jgi:hypothetical protein